MSDDLEMDDIQVIEPPAGPSAGPSTSPTFRKRVQEPDTEEEDERRPAKRQKLPTPPPKPLPRTDDTLPGLGREEEGTFMIKLPRNLVRWFRYPSDRPFSTARLKLEVLSRLSSPANMDSHFMRTEWKDISSEEGRHSLQKVIRDGLIIVITGFKDEYGTCGWDEISNLGGPDDVLTTEYPFHAVGKLEPDCSISVEELEKFGVEGSPIWGSTSLPLPAKTQAPLLDFLADDYLSWNLGSTHQIRPPNARPESFATFNWHHIIQREMLSPILQDRSGKIKVSLQRCGHRIVFWCKVTAKWTKLRGPEYAEMVWRMEDFERMGKWYCVVLRPGELLIQPPGVIHIIYTPENNILRVSQFLTYHHLPNFEAYRRNESSRELWTPKFTAMSILRTMYRMAISLQTTRSDADIPYKSFPALARMVLRPEDYLPRVRADDEAVRARMHAIQRRFLYLLRTPGMGKLGDAADDGLEVSEEVLKEEAADYGLASQVVRRRLMMLGMLEDRLDEY